MILFTVKSVHEFHQAIRMSTASSSENTDEITENNLVSSHFLEMDGVGGQVTH